MFNPFRVFVLLHLIANLKNVSGKGLGFGSQAVIQCASIQREFCGAQPHQAEFGACNPPLDSRVERTCQHGAVGACGPGWRATWLFTSGTLQAGVVLCELGAKSKTGIFGEDCGVREGQFQHVSMINSHIWASRYALRFWWFCTWAHLRTAVLCGLQRVWRDSW